MSILNPIPCPFCLDHHAFDHDCEWGKLADAHAYLALAISNLYKLTDKQYCPPDLHAN